MLFAIRKVSGLIKNDAIVGYSVKDAVLQDFLRESHIKNEVLKFEVSQTVHEDYQTFISIVFVFDDVPGDLDTTRISTILQLLADKLYDRCVQEGILEYAQLKSFFEQHLGSSWGWHHDSERMEKICVTLLPA